MVAPKPQLAKTADDLLALRRRGYVLEPKFDGDRAIVVKHGADVRLYARSGVDKTHLVPWLIESLSHYPGDFILDGEAAIVGSLVDFKGRLVPIVDFNATRSAMGASAPKALAVQRAHGPVALIVFDALELDGRNLRPLPESLRRAVLNQVVSWFAQNEVPGVILAPRWADWTPNDANALIDAGAEGAMFKNSAAPYREGGRPEGAWYKFKRIDTVDAVITGYQPGKGKYVGQIGAVLFRWRDADGVLREGRCSGMDDAERLRISRDPEGYKGRVIEVAYTGQKGEGLRHPRWKGLRDDKTAAECLA
jgi:bifunctional non-homologous end joining protein LigD